MNSKNLKPSLGLCILLDAIGMISYILPFVGEGFDAVWAPISALLMLNLFGGKTGKAGAILAFIEEAIPFTDLVPSFTIMYFIKNFTQVFKNENNQTENTEDAKVIVIK